MRDDCNYCSICGKSHGSEFDDKYNAPLLPESWHLRDQHLNEVLRMKYTRVMNAFNAIDYSELRELICLAFPQDDTYTTPNCLGFKSNGVWYPVSNVGVEIHKNMIVLKELSKDNNESDKNE